MDPVHADQFADMNILRYVIVACLTLCIWDWMLAFSDELRMVRINNGRGRRFPYCLIVLYMLLRLAPIIAKEGCVPTQSAPPWPTNIAVASILFDCLTLPTASLLFYIRLSAIYLHGKRAMASFGMIWGAVMGYAICACVQAYEQFTLIHTISPSNTTAWIFIANVIFDTLVYLAASWRLSAFSTAGDSRKQRFLSFTIGKGLLSLTKALLRSGQFYYFTTIIIGTANIIFIMSNPLKSGTLSVILVPPHVTIASILACCRIFRETKLVTPHSLPISNLKYKPLSYPPHVAIEDPED
ncbi:hypothetical protein FIBSPDRAFT_947212 [Athelia psychrophila]|uniref:DUF6533 domain-containing protein n=1 Tax=Athelia psychrophila TaxID=1759441 RepID=A0A166RYJ7_9AGAM|nr:hypothetical protein FIBSPDRAFT_947212 [Fibularhizoctonia sp. CBS 109695]